MLSLVSHVALIFTGKRLKTLCATAPSAVGNSNRGHAITNCSGSPSQRIIAHTLHVIDVVSSVSSTHPSDIIIFLMAACHRLWISAGCSHAYKLTSWARADIS